MSETDQDQKTHDPTDKKLQDARERGDVPSAPEVRHAVMMVAAIATVGILGRNALAGMSPMLVHLWGNADALRLTPDGAQAFATGIFANVAVILAPLLGASMGFALVAGLAQGRPVIAWSRVAPKFSKLSPVAGAGRLFGKRALIELGKTAAKAAVVLGAASMVLRPKMAGLDALVGGEPADIATASAAVVLAMLKTVALLTGALALFDIVYQRRSFLKRMRMSLQEIKDEHKQSEGDPKIKAKIRQLGMQRARRRMMAKVPQASVVVTNPTHYAVALRYEHGSMNAPVVVAKGVDQIALRIRSLAGSSGVPIVENRPLARALYASAELDRPIPIEHYAAVAEVIGYVMRLAAQKGG